MNIARSRRAVTNDFLWVIGVVIVVVIAGVAWLAFMVRATDTTLIRQDYTARNLAYLSTLILASPGFVSYEYTGDDSFKISYDRSLVSAAAAHSSLGNDSGYAAPTVVLHPFPSEYQLDREQQMFETISFTNLRKALLVTVQPIQDRVCTYYVNYPLSQESFTIVLLGTPETKDMRKAAAQRTSNVLFEIDQKNNGDSRRVIIYVQENPSLEKESITLATPDFEGKKLACLFAQEYDAEIVQHEIQEQDSVHSTDTILALDVQKLDAERLSSVLAQFTRQEDTGEASA